MLLMVYSSSNSKMLLMVYSSSNSKMLLMVYSSSNSKMLLMVYSSSNSKKQGQYNDQMKKDKRTNNNLNKYYIVIEK
jgi:hypothetical protein